MRTLLVITTRCILMMALILDRIPSPLIAKHSSSDTPLRVAIITVESVPMYSEGGHSVYVLKVGQLLSEMGYNVTWFTRSMTPSQVGMVTLSPTLRLQYVVAGPQKIIHIDHLLPHVQQFATHIDSTQFDCTFTNYWMSGYVGLLLGLPQLHVPHSRGAPKYQFVPIPDIGPFRLWVEDALDKNVDCMVHQTVSEMEAIKAKNPALIKPGIDAETFRALESHAAKQELSFRNNTINVLFAGRFASGKGIAYAIEAMKKTKVPHTFRLIGNYTDIHVDTNLELTRKNPQFEIHGHLPANELYKYMAASDILIIPSLYESFGLVAIEGMAAGCSIIASSVGGLDEIIQDGVHGIKVPPADSEAIHVAFEKLASNPKRMQEIGEYNRRVALEEYSWTSTARKIGNRLADISRREGTMSSKILYNINSLLGVLLEVATRKAG